MSGSKVSVEYKRKPTIRGSFVMNPGGFGFVNREDGKGSLFIPPGKIGGALDGDLVMVEVRKAERGDEGNIVDVARRHRTRIVGTLESVGHRRWRLVPDDPRIIHRVLVTEGVAEAFDPDAVIAARIVRYPGPKDAEIEVALERELGQTGELVCEAARILVENGVNEKFPKAALKEAKHVPTAVKDSERKNRADLLHIPFMTIDPPDARDFDDAVAVVMGAGAEQTEVMRLYVAVADVSHYVRPDTAIDEEALLRLYSVYLPDRAIPMLPEQLSSHMCSLVPEQDRLAMVVAMDVDPDGHVDNVEVMASVIHSRKRLTYYDAAKVMANEEHGLTPEICKRVLQLRACADRLRRVRLERGAVELSLPESKIILDQDDKSRIRDIVKTRADESVARAYNLIEELMLAANEAVGRLGLEHELPVVYRAHDQPDQAKLEIVAAAATALGVRVALEDLQTPKGVQQFLARVGEEPKLQVLHYLVLRSMAQAEYRVGNPGHFALASPAYVHFTSPIRRYADLISHRVMKAYLAETGGPCGSKASVAQMPARSDVSRASFECSWRERAIAQVERMTKGLYAAAFVRDRVGDQFSGRVSSVQQNGLTISIDEPFVDGFMPLVDTAVGDQTRYRWTPDDTGVRIIGQPNNRVICVGDRIDVVLVRVDLTRRQIEFGWVESGDSVVDRSGLTEMIAEKTGGIGKPRRRAAVVAATPQRAVAPAIARRRSEPSPALQGDDDAGTTRSGRKVLRASGTAKPGRVRDPAKAVASSQRAGTGGKKTKTGKVAEKATTPVRGRPSKPAATTAKRSAKKRK